MIFADKGQARILLLQLVWDDFRALVMQMNHTNILGRWQGSEKSLYVMCLLATKCPPCFWEGICYNHLVPKVGIEPTLPREHEFESCASACSATSAENSPFKDE